MATATRYLHPLGDDLNNGLTPETAWATPNRVVTYVNGAPSNTEINIYVSAGSYVGGLYFANPPVGGSVSVTCEEGCLFDCTSGGAGVGAGGATSHFYLNGAVFSGSSISSANGVSQAYGHVHVYNGIFDGFDDGFSCHFSGNGYVYDCIFRNCHKSAFAHVHDTQTWHYRCVFEGRSGATLGIGSNLSTLRAYFEDCLFIPAFNGQVFAPTRSDLLRCQVGTEAQFVSLGNWSGNMNSNFTNCFWNATHDGFGNSTWRLCFGRWTIRSRGTQDKTGLIENCVFVGPANVTTNRWFHASYYVADGTWESGSVTVRNTIFTGYGQVIEAGNVTNGINSFWTMESLCYFGNTTNHSAGVNLPDPLITGNPLLGSSNTTSQSDYTTAENSPCRLSGTPFGYNIGLPVRVIGEIASGGATVQPSHSLPVRVINESFSGGVSVLGDAVVRNLPIGYDLRPVIKFRVNLRPLQNNMTIGPVTNEQTTGVPVLIDLTNLVEMSIPGISQHLRHGDEFFLQGELASRTVRNHSNGIEGDYTSTPLVVVKRY